MKAKRQFMSSWVAILLALFLSGGVGLSLALADVLSGDSTPEDYTTVSLRQAREELEDLQFALNSSNLSTSELYDRIRMIATRNKRGLRREGDTHTSDHVIDVTGMTLPHPHKK